MKFDLLVVAASFAGIGCAREAPLAGQRVCVIDRKPHPGARLHTTRLLVREVAEIGWLRAMPLALTRPIPAVCVYAPWLRHVRLQAPGYHFLATDIAGLMRWMVEQAMRVGVVFCWGRRCRRCNQTRAAGSSTGPFTFATRSAPTGRIPRWRGSAA